MEPASAIGAPLVSVCLPNLNTLPFLEERIATIRAQTYQNWELIVSDNYSDDGAWEFFQRLAKTDERVSIRQAPREGMYANWNNCIQRSTGEFVYIATSDDTMAEDCLEKLVNALQVNPDCDLAHCHLRMIDAAGRELDDWWARESIFAISSGSLFNRPHVRAAPFDGLLHLSGENVYLSITQLLMRRSVFDRLGLFESRWGSMGDFEWEMRAGLTVNVVSVPETWGGWRIHDGQATAAVRLACESREVHLKKDEMIAHAIQATQHLLPPRLGVKLQQSWMRAAYDLREFLAEIRAEPLALRRWWYMANQLARGRGAVARLLIAKRLFREPMWPWMARKWARRAGVNTPLRIL
jgi:hypothetical protein